MSQVARMLLSIEGLLSVSFIGVLWLWIQPHAAPLVDQFDGPFTSSWSFLEVALPVLVGVYYLIFVLYLIYGPVQEERARNVQRRRI